MRAKSASLNALLLLADLALSGSAAAGFAFLVSPGLPWLLVFSLMWGAYLAFTLYCLRKGPSVLARKLRAYPLDLAPRPESGKAIREGLAPAPGPVLLRASSASINALSLGSCERGYLVLTDGALEELKGPELSALVRRELARLRNGDAAVWLMYARLTMAPTLFARLAGRRGYDAANPALSRAFFFTNTLLFAVFWFGMMLAANGSGAYRVMLIIGMPSCMVIMTLLTNLLVSLPLLGLLRTVDWRSRELAADRAAAGTDREREALASVFDKALQTALEAGTSSFDRSAWAGPIRLRKSYFINPEAFFQIGGWNPQPSLAERKKYLLAV